MKTMLIRFGVLLSAFGGFFGYEYSWCQTYPAKPIRIITSATLAGGGDIVARTVAQKLSESTGQQVIVDNRPGASGVIASQMTIAAPPDGYTVLLSTANGMAISPMLAKKQPYDPVQDFIPVTLLATAPLLAAVHPSLPAQSLNELINLAKAHPRQLLYASNGTGTIQHLATEMFSQAAGITLVHVPYNGGAPAAVDTISGQVQMVITAVPTLLAHVKASRLRALAVTSGKRSSAVPDLPTFAESGLSGFEAVQWFAVFAPKKTPAAVTDKLYAEIRKAAESPSVKASLDREGADLAVNGPQALSEFQRIEIARWQKVIRLSGIVLE